MRSRAFLIFLHVAIWLAVYLLPFLIEYGTININTLLNEGGGGIHLISTALLIGYAYSNHEVLVPRFYLNRKYFAYTAIVIISLLFVIWLPPVIGALWHAGARPPMLHNEPPHGRSHSEGHLSIGGPSYNVILFIICTFVSISIRQQRQLLEVQKEKLDAELSFLKAQINPHFLFNTLNSIYALAITKSDDTPKAIIQLSELMRYILKDSDADTVPLNRELSYISNYVALQKRRLGNTVQINYAAPAGIVNGKMAPLILTSFVENAFKHGVNPDQDSAINISITLSDNQLQLYVLNNKVTSIDLNETMGIGLKNAISRLEHLYAGKHELVIDDNEKTFSITLTLQLND